MSSSRFFFDSATKFIGAYNDGFFNIQSNRNKMALAVSNKSIFLLKIVLLLGDMSKNISSKQRVPQSPAFEEAENLIKMR